MYHFSLCQYMKTSAEGETFAPDWTMERGNKGEQAIHSGVVYWASPQGALQINLSLTPGANHNFKTSLRPISLWPSGLSLRQHPLSLGLVRIGHGAPVKHMGCGRGLISSAKWGEWVLGFDVLNPRRTLRTEKAGGMSESRVDYAILRMIIPYFKALTKNIFLPLKVNTVSRPILRRGD